MDIYQIKTSPNKSFKHPTPITWLYITYLDSFQATLQHLPKDAKRKWIWKVNKSLYTPILQSPTDTQALNHLKACIPEEEWTYNPETHLITPHKPSSTITVETQHLASPLAPPQQPQTPTPIQINPLETQVKTLCTDPIYEVPINKAIITPYGNTFDESALLQALQTTQIDPIAKLPLSPQDLIDNLTVSSAQSKNCHSKTPSLLTTIVRKVRFYWPSSIRTPNLASSAKGLVTTETASKSPKSRH